jgi:hypothetical protein
MPTLPDPLARALGKKKMPKPKVEDDDPGYSHKYQGTTPTFQRTGETND